MTTMRSLCVVAVLSAFLAVAQAAQFKAMLPEKCKGLQEVHGDATVNSWFLSTAQEMPEVTPEDLCDRALVCKRLLRPLMTRDNKYIKACPNNCNGNGICADGVCQCSPGYRGLDCSIMRCPGNCNSHGDCKLGRCFCEPGFGGDSCEKTLECPQFANKACAGHGECSRGKCFCNPGFSGDDCSSVATCPNDCSNRGFCLHGMCFCPPGYGGADCAPEPVATPCLNDCSGHGECSNGKCLCEEGHFGKDCSKVVECPRALNGLVCSGHGSCHNGQCECEVGRAGFTCSLQLPCPGNGTCSGRGLCYKSHCYCYPGAEGDACDRDSPCASGCNGNGVCVEGKCHCLPGFAGIDCAEGAGVNPSKCPPTNNTTPEWNQDTIKDIITDLAGCPNGCSGAGVCLNGTCACIAGHLGQDCSISSEPLKCPNGCSYRGVCVFGKCSCLPPYTGPDCSESTDPSVRPTECPANCNGRGDCVRGRCVCDPGYAGAACDVEVPCKNNCNGRGRCDRGKCFCFPGFAGGACEKVAKCTGGCSAHGQCFYGRCFCDPFYSGEDCSKTPHCSKGCSLEHGICRGIDNCVCEAGWTGVDCLTKLQCPEDCNGPDHGACLATERGTQCVCKTPWVGPTCAQREDQCLNDCSGKGVCVMGECKCQAGYTGKDCSSRMGGETLMDTINGNSQGAAQSQSAPAEARFVSLRAEAPRPMAAFVKGKALEDAALNTAASTSPSTQGDFRFRATTEVTAGVCPNDCSARGVCADGICACDAGFAGDDCSVEIHCPNDCGAHGVCQKGRCYCEPDFTGDDCNAPVQKNRQFPQAWVTTILCFVTFFVGIVVGRKTLANSIYKNLGSVVDVDGK